MWRSATLASAGRPSLTFGQRKWFEKSGPFLTPRGVDPSRGLFMMNDQASQDILLVEDDVDLREALAELLEGRGFRVSTATNGADALQRLQSMPAPPDVILLDLMMPVMDGYGFLDARRVEPLLASIPVIVVTAAHALDRARLGDLTPVIRKPIQLPQLMSALRQFGASGSA
jgi:CheY-like chemotaxis protein